MKQWALLTVLTYGQMAAADAPYIAQVTAGKSQQGWQFDVTILHADTGWDHYADGWRVEDADGNQLGLRVLAHPHVNEQPFTRSLGAVFVPDSMTKVYVRSRCNVHGWSEDVYEVDLR